MHEILDGVNPDYLRPLFKNAFRPLQADYLKMCRALKIKVPDRGLQGLRDK